MYLRRCGKDQPDGSSTFLACDRLNRYSVGSQLVKFESDDSQRTTDRPGREILVSSQETMRYCHQALSALHSIWWSMLRCHRNEWSEMSRRKVGVTSNQSSNKESPHPRLIHVAVSVTINAQYLVFASSTYLVCFKRDLRWLNIYPESFRWGAPEAGLKSSNDRVVCRPRKVVDIKSL